MPLLNELMYNWMTEKTCHKKDRQRPGYTDDTISETLDRGSHSKVGIHDHTQ